MSSEWEPQKLGDCVTFHSGNTPSKAEPRFWDGSTPWISAKDMKSFWVEDSEDHLTSEGVVAASSIVPPGTTLMLTRGMTLHNDIPIVRTRKPAAFNQDVKALMPKHGTDPEFVPYLLLGNKARIQALVDSAGHGTGRLSTEQLKSMMVSRPPLCEQRELCAILGALDDRISLLRETNATLEAIAQALFKSWFVDFDPVRAKSQGLAPAGMDEATAALFPDGFEESPLGPVPAGWPCIDLGDLTHRYGGAIQTGPFGSQLHAKDYVDTGIPVVMPKDIVGRRVSIDSIARVGVTDAERLARHKLQAGDIVFSRRGDVERHALITEREVGWLCGTGCLLVRPGPRWESPGFLSMLLDAPRARTWLVQHAVGATMPNLNSGILSSVPLVLPPPALLAAFDDVVAVTEEQRSRNATMAETLADIRDTLLPRLISGQLRLPPVDEAVAEATHAD